MLRSASYTRRVLLLFIITGSITRLTAQAVTQQQAAFKTTLNTTGAVPVKKNYDEDAKSWYAVYNTGNTIHVYLAVTDPQQQRKIVMNGVELWIDPKGKKNKKTGITFPFNEVNEKPLQGRPPGFSVLGNPGNHTTPDTNNIKALEKMIAMHREIRLTGFKQDLNGVQNMHHPSGIDVAMYFIKDTLVYEAQLPLNTLSEPLSVNSRVAVCLVEKGMTMPVFGGNEMPPDGGGGGDGMMPPPGPPPGAEDGMRFFEDNTIWCKFLLQGMNDTL